MSCPHCNAALQPGQQFCIHCGAPVVAATSSPPPPPPPGFLPPPPIDPRPPSSSPPAAPPGSPATFTIIEQTPPIALQPDSWGAVAPLVATAAPATSPIARTSPTVVRTEVHNAWPSDPGAPASEPALGTSRGQTVFAVIAGLAGIAAIVGSFLPVLTLQTDAPITPLGDFGLNDILGGTNLQVAFAVGGVALLVGAIMANLGLRFGAGLAGGAALALVPYLAWVWGRTALLSDQAEAAARSAVANGGRGTFIETTPGVGIWVLLGATALGLIALCVGFATAGRDSMPPLNRAVCLGGALASLAAAAGPLIPLNGSSFSDNFDTDASTAWLVYSRLGVLAVVAIAGLTGFLRCNRWGVGFAIGGVVMFAWQWVSSLAELGAQPFPPAFQNPGGDFKPYALTTIGVAAMLALAVIALVIGGKREEVVPPTTLTTPDYRRAG